VIDGRSSLSAAPPGYRFPREVIPVAVRWYLRYGLSSRDVEELLAERGVDVGHVTVCRWVQTFTPELSRQPAQSVNASGDRRFLDETYVKAAGRGTYLDRVVDRHAQVIDVLVSTRLEAAAARQFFARALRAGPSRVEVTTDRALVSPRVVEDLVAAARHVTEQYADNLIEADHGRLKSRLLTRRTDGTRHRERRLPEGQPAGGLTVGADVSVGPP